jgi:hypothetical protein
MIFESIDVSDRQTNIMQEVMTLHDHTILFQLAFSVHKKLYGFQWFFGSMVVSDRQRNIL